MEEPDKVLERFRGNWKTWKKWRRNGENRKI